MAIKLPPTVPATNVEESVESLVEGFDSLKPMFIGRDEVLDAIQLAMVCGQHVIVDGLHGLAKSQVATAAFSAVRDAKLFERQFNASSLVEEILGPISLSDLREKDRVRYNTQGMIPEADFAFLDELYRAPDQLLTVLMSILNERRFFNAGVRVECPLVTAVATVNFVVNTAELAAFRDRWLFWVRVKPTGRERRAHLIEHMLKMDQHIEVRDDLKITVEELNAIRHEVHNVKIDTYFIEVVALLLNEFETASSKSGLVDTDAYISDRRIRHIITALRGHALLNGRRTVQQGDLEALEHMLVFDPEKQSQLLSQARVNAEKELTSIKADLPGYENFHAQFLEWKKKAANIKSKDSALKVHTSGTKTLEAIEINTPEEWVKTSRALRERFKRDLGEFRRLIDGIAYQYGLKVGDSVKSEDDED